jgi:hypothetical protein
MNNHFRAILLFMFNSLEAIIWLAALTALATAPPSDSHFTLCPLKNAGFQFCPGCGLGHSITLIFHGDFASSIQMHPLGFIALGILSWRIVTVFRNSMQLLKFETTENLQHTSNQ